MIRNPRARHILELLLALALLRAVPAAPLHAVENERRLLAVSRGTGEIFLSWRLLPTDPPDVSFNIYRAESADGPYALLSGGENLFPTNFVDGSVAGGVEYFYRVRAVPGGGGEGPDSNTASASADGSTDGRVLEILDAALDLNPAGPGVGDLDGDGLLDFVVLDMNFYDRVPSRKPILRAYLHDGTPYWGYATRYRYRREAPGMVLPFVVWDLDGDGRSEVIVRTGDLKSRDTYLTILRGDVPGTPEVIDSILFPSALDDSEPRLRPHYISVAYLDGPGQRPSIVTQVAVHEGERITAFDLSPQLTLSQRWDYHSDLASGTSGSGTHGIPVYDIDGDGRDEVFDGSTLLDDDGSVLWTLHALDGRRVRHPDVVIPGEIDPQNPGPEVWFVAEGSPQGVYLADSNGGILWEEQGWRHGHDGWAADITPDYPGAELYAYDLRSPTNDGPDRMKLFTSSGQLIFTMANLETDRFHHPVQWDDDPEIEILHNDAKIILNFDGSSAGWLPDRARLYNLQMDVTGDYREEFLIMNPDYDWIRIYTATTPVADRRVSGVEDVDYLKTASRATASYWKYFSP
jgi:rhamnogalacturonan endolyase